MTPMRYNLFSNLLNVFGNYVLIFGKFGFPAMGVAGAALSTTLCRGVAAFLALRAIFNKNRNIGVSLKDDYRIDKNLLERLISIGLPSAMEQFCSGWAGVFLPCRSRVGNGYLCGTPNSNQYLFFDFTPGQAFGMAATTMVGQSLGAKHPDVAEKAGLAARRMGLIIALAIAIVLFFFGYDVALLYTDEPEVARAAANALKILAIMQPMQSTQFILAGALRGAGDTRWPLYSTAIVFGVSELYWCTCSSPWAWVSWVLGWLSCVTRPLERCSSTAGTNRVPGSIRGYERQRQQRTLPQEITLIKCY